MEQAGIRYAPSADGVNIAYATFGSGKPLLFARQLFADPVDDVLSGIDAGIIESLSASHAVVVWDPRGSRNSSGAYNLKLEASLADIEAVANAVGGQSFDVLAMLGPVHAAVAYAAAHPGQVSRMVLYNPSPPGDSPRTMSWRDLPDIAGTHFREYMQLAALRIYGWDNPAPAKRLFERMTTYFTPESWASVLSDMETVDATSRAPDVRARTLVIIDSAGAVIPDFVTPERQAFMRKLSTMIPECELAIFRRGEGAQWIERVRAFLTAGAADATVGLPSGTAVILFTDIADSTALTERMGDAAFRAASRRIDDDVRAAVRAAGGTPVTGKVLGDGVMGVFASAAQAIEAARRCVAISGELPLHIGIHAGDVTGEQDNVYGGAVNIASRICGLCEPGEILVSQTVRDLARTSAGVTFEGRGEHALKGIEDPVRVFAVRPESG